MIQNDTNGEQDRNEALCTTFQYSYRCGYAAKPSNKSHAPTVYESSAVVCSVWTSKENGYGGNVALFAYFSLESQGNVHRDIAR